MKPQNLGLLKAELLLPGEQTANCESFLTSSIVPTTELTQSKPSLQDALNAAVSV